MAIFAAVHAGAFKSIGTGRGGSLSTEYHAKYRDPVFQKRHVWDNHLIPWSQTGMVFWPVSRTGKNVHQRLRRWCESGVIERILRHLAADHDKEYMMLTERSSRLTSTAWAC